MTLQDEYSKLVASGKVKDDASQRHILSKLEQLKAGLEEYFSPSRRGIKKIIPFPKNHKLKGLYLYGAVGRGKSMLMDLFYTHLDMDKKKRVHFHAFMLDIHARLHKWHQENKDDPEAKDPIPAIAKDIAKTTVILCFDEVQVTDIADAMILGRLFTELFKHRIIVVATSNRAPDGLYKDGLQRERFLPFISMIKEQLEVEELQASKDYRFSHLKSLSKLYYYPLDKNADKFIEDAFAELTFGATPETVSLKTGSRKLTIKKTYNDIAWLSFSDLCEKALGAADYIAIASEFSTILLENIPQMNKESRNEAKRFVTLIDELYEHKVKLIATAAVPPESLYITGDGSFEFARTVSRLVEMQSEQYLIVSHLVQVDKG